MRANQYSGFQLRASQQQLHTFAVHEQQDVLVYNTMFLQVFTQKVDTVVE